MDVSIIIPTKNAGDLLDTILERVFKQNTSYTYEVICVDSGSTDDTINVIKKYPVKLFEIHPSEFGHGKTRNFGAAQGTGEFIVFITQDALPCDENWLENFINAMKMDEEIAGGFGRHVPYGNCNVLDNRDITVHFKGFGDKDTVYMLDDPERYEKEEGYRHFLAFFSDNNSCLRRSVWKEIPYDDVDFAEDQIWCRKIIENHYKKVYCPSAAVYHSHNYPLKSYFKRYYDEYKGIYELHQYRIAVTPFKILPLSCWLTKNDIKYILTLEALSIKKKLKWIYYAAARNFYKVHAGYLGGKYHLLSSSKQQKMDMKHSMQYLQRNIMSGENTMLLVKVKNVLKTEGISGLIKRVRSRLKSPELISIPMITGKRGLSINFAHNIEKIPFSNDDYKTSKLKDDNVYINWIVPEVGIGSGGHINIFRFASFLQQKGHKNRIYVFGGVAYTRDEPFKRFIYKYFDIDKTIELYCNTNNIQFADATIATSWQTAYFVNAFDNTLKKFYFVQDYEPYFYALGSEYVFAQNTYKMGLVGLTAGDWLKNKLSKEFEMKCTSFLFSYDKEFYKPMKKRDNIKRVLFYARPVTPRRMFEIGLLALTDFNRKCPDVDIIFAGWDISDYAIPFPHLNAGSVKVSELSDLYSQCDIVLTLSGTNLSLLPLEVMACYTAVMSNRGENVDWLLDEQNSVLCDLSVEDIALKLEDFFTNIDAYSKIVENGYKFSIGTDWTQEGLKVEKAILEELGKHE